MHVDISTDRQIQLLNTLTFWSNVWLKEGEKKNKKQHQQQ